MLWIVIFPDILFRKRRIRILFNTLFCGGQEMQAHFSPYLTVRDLGNTKAKSHLLAQLMAAWPPLKLRMIVLSSQVVRICQCTSVFFHCKYEDTWGEAVVCLVTKCARVYVSCVISLPRQQLQYEFTSCIMLIKSVINLLPWFILGIKAVENKGGWFQDMNNPWNSLLTASCCLCLYFPMLLP